MRKRTAPSSVRGRAPARWITYRSHATNAGRDSCVFRRRSRPRGASITRMADAVALALAPALLAIAGLLFVLYRRIAALSDSVGVERMSLQAELDRREEYVAALARE